MLVPVKWMKNYIDIKKTTREISDRVTDSGSHVESISKLDEGIDNLIVGEIKEIKSHPTRSKLSILDIDLGDEVISLITGAKNMKLGDKVVVAVEGSLLPGGITIGVADFDGITSPGMLCSYDELGVDSDLVSKEEKDGIIILDSSIPNGSKATEVLDLDDEIIEFEITPNRPDCLSIIGMAREVGATFGKEIQLPSTNIHKEYSKIENFIDEIEIESENVNRFIVRVLDDVKVSQSPQWIKNYLMNAGIRPINNVVDIGNFVMLEYGQPIHTYDLDKLSTKGLIVRQANSDEKIKTLDGVDRNLDSEDIIIADLDNKPLGIAGIMGGEDTEVDFNTKKILIESANFNSENIRKTSKRLNLKSEASFRFEKYISVETAEIAVNRYLSLAEEIGLGKPVKGSIDYGNKESESHKITLRPERVNSLLGVNLDLDKMVRYLESLELIVENIDGNLEVFIPHFRSDLRIEADLIEEIGRLYGFHNIKAQPLKGTLTRGLKSDDRKFIDSLRNDLYALGYYEILTYSFISKKTFDKLNLNENNDLRNTVNIVNPLGEDFSVMRTTLIGNMLETVRKNLNNKVKDLRLSEIGNIFLPENKKRDYQEKVMTIALVGDYDFYYLKDNIVKLLSKNGVKDLDFTSNKNSEIFHAGRCADIFINNEHIGIMGEIDYIVRENYGIGERVYLAEIDLDKILSHGLEPKRYKPISKYPTIERDIALVVDKGLESKRIIDIMRENGGENLKSIELFDIYTGNQIGEGKKSLAYKLGFQSSKRTLKDKEVKEAFDNIISALNEKLDINLRG